jgi:quercetin dioxygenase-like cupin family protein
MATRAQWLAGSWLAGLTLSLAAIPMASGEYPVPGRPAGTTAFATEGRAEHLASGQYPQWFRGKRNDGRADEFAKYFYTQLIGPAAAAAGAGGPSANELRMGTLTLKPGATYPAHNHPAREIYYVMQGEADWFVDDEKQHVTEGAVIMHRPYAVHGWTNTSANQPLKVIWIRWLENHDRPDVLDQGARLVNPESAKDEITARPFAVPLPHPHP